LLALFLKAIFVFFEVHRTILGILNVKLLHRVPHIPILVLLHLTTMEKFFTTARLIGSFTNFI